MLDLDVGGLLPIEKVGNVSHVTLILFHAGMHYLAVPTMFACLPTQRPKTGFLVVLMLPDAVHSTHKYLAAALLLSMVIY